MLLTMMDFLLSSWIFYSHELSIDIGNFMSEKFWLASNSFFLFDLQSKSWGEKEERERERERERNDPGCLNYKLRTRTC